MAPILQWRHNGHDGVSSHQPHQCLLNRFFGRRSKKTSKLRVTGLGVWKYIKISLGQKHHRKPIRHMLTLVECGELSGCVIHVGLISLHVIQALLTSESMFYDTDILFIPCLNKSQVYSSNSDKAIMKQPWTLFVFWEIYCKYASDYVSCIPYLKYTIAECFILSSRFFMVVFAAWMNHLPHVWWSISLFMGWNDFDMADMNILQIVHASLYVYICRIYPMGFPLK